MIIVTVAISFGVCTVLSATTQRVSISSYDVSCVEIGAELLLAVFPMPFVVVEGPTRLSAA